MNPRTFLSWPFLATVLSAVAVWLTTLGHSVNPHYAYIFTGVVAGIYAVARGIGKLNGPFKSVFLTTEFWVVIIGAVIVSFGYFQGHMSTALWTAINGFLVLASTIAHQLASPPTTQGRVL